jgi:hypothetical protein
MTAGEQYSRCKTLYWTYPRQEKGICGVFVWVSGGGPNVSKERWQIFRRKEFPVPVWKPEKNLFFPY